MGVVDMLARIQPVPLFTFQVNTNDISTQQNKIQMLFSFSFSISTHQILLINRQTWETRNKGGVNGQGNTGGGRGGVVIVMFITLFF